VCGTGSAERQKEPAPQPVRSLTRTRGLVMLPLAIVSRADGSDASVRPCHTMIGRRERSSGPTRPRHRSPSHLTSRA
jgi:hypothetical protein